MILRTFSRHRAIVAVLAAFIALAGAYSIATPLFEAPDEQWHFAFVQYMARGRGLPVQKPGEADHLARQEGSQPPLYYFIAAGAISWIDTSDFPGVVWENPHYGFGVPGVVNDNKNLFIHTALEGFPWRNAALAIHIARFVSVLFGALAVLFTYWLALELFNGERVFAAMSAAFVAFVPQFLFIGGAVNNDSAVVAISALALWLLARTLRLAPTPRDWLVIGAVIGLAALAKVSGLALFGLGTGTVLYHGWRAKRLAIGDGRLEITRSFSLFTFAFLLICGWWYARNLILYGELTGTEMMLSIFGARVTPLTLAQFDAQMNEVRDTFWLGFGWGNVRAHPLVYLAFDVLRGIAGVGILIGIVRERDKRALIALLVVWILVVIAALIRWMMLTQAPHGRLLFPALPALAPLIVFGLTQFFPRSRQTSVAVFAPGALFAFSLYALVAILQPAYAFPAMLTESEVAKIANRVDVVYDAKMKLLGYDVLPRRVLPDGSVTVTLYWQALAQMEEDYSIGIALLDADRRVLSQRNSYPGHGTLPTRLWRAGQMIQDTYWLAIPANAPAPSVAQIQVSLFKRETQRDLPALDPSGNAITPIVGQIKVASSQPVEARPQYRTEYTFGNQITLIGYDIDPNGLTLYWKRIAPILNDYTVFVHWLDANGNIMAQKDAEPSMPTSLWDDGEVVIDRRAFDLRGANRVRVGLYRAETGERLRVGNDDNVVLGVGQ